MFQMTPFLINVFSKLGKQSITNYTALSYDSLKYLHDILPLNEIFCNGESDRVSRPGQYQCSERNEACFCCELY